MNRNINYKHLLQIFTILVIFASCTSSFKTIYIETAKPSSSMLSNDIVSLTLMNRSVTNEFNNFQSDSLQRFFYRQKFSVSSVFLDSMSVDTTLKVLGELLYESGRYDVVIPEDRNIYRGLKFYKVPEDLNWNYVENICDLYHTDALLVLERYFNKISTGYDIAGYSYSGDEVYEATIDSKYDAVVKIYDPQKKEIIRKMVVSDTISWYAEGLKASEVFSKLPVVKDVLIKTGIQVALDIDDNLSPSWQTEQRGFFTINSKSDSISTYINQGDWVSAYNYWLPFAESSGMGLRSKAEFNLALASEMIGDIDDAIEWAKKSYYTQYRKQTEDYISKLAERKESLQKFEELEN